MRRIDHSKPILSFILSVILLASGSNLSYALAEYTALPTYAEFVASLPPSSGLAGVYADQLFAFPIRQQPVNNTGYVSSEPDVVTEFALAKAYDTTGLLAHNTLAGAWFAQLQVGHTITVAYSDGTSKAYEVAQIDRYQALSPTNPRSDFVPLEQPGIRLSASQLFNKIYAPGQRLVLQTCIEAHGNPSWGRLFVIAFPKSVPPVKVLTTYPLDWMFGISYRAQ